MTAPFLRVERGEPDPAELAALVVVLDRLAAAGADGRAAAPVGPARRWRDRGAVLDGGRRRGSWADHGG